MRFQQIIPVRKTMDNNDPSVCFSENVRSTLMLIPTVAVNAFCFLPSYIVIITTIVLGTGKNISSPSYDISIVIVEWANTLLPLYSILYPIICFRRNAGLRADFIRLMPALVQKWIASVWRQQDPVKSLKSNQPETAHEYFDFLAKFWRSSK